MYFGEKVGHSTFLTFYVLSWSVVTLHAFFPIHIYCIHSYACDKINNFYESIIMLHGRLDVVREREKCVLTLGLLAFVSLGLQFFFLGFSTCCLNFLTTWRRIPRLSTPGDKK